MYAMSGSMAGRPPRFSREQLARVAFEIADREGFGAVSMRRVAQELGVIRVARAGAARLYREWSALPVGGTLRVTWPLHDSWLRLL
jgi:hypothetical protein